ncbi:MAG: hypothetical protein CVU98_00835 [Firmicutes bacterium HGW-Firmicutes-3]|nr:MAG: hypothetical protein CVU98_00835 [Firmicutes bacterium HGW-Firmicutes-3]
MNNRVLFLFVIVMTFLLSGCDSERLLSSYLYGDDDFVSEVVKLVELEKFDEALIKIDPKLKSGRFAIADMNNIAVSFIDKDQSEDAINILQIIETKFPGDEAVANNLSWGYNELRLYKIANYYADLTLSKEPNDPIEFVNKAAALNGLDKDEESLEFYQKAYAINPKEQFAISGIMVLSYNLGDYDETIRAFNEYELLYPEDSKNYLFYLTDAYVKQIKFDEAIEVYNYHYSKEPSDTNYLYSIGNIYMSEMKDYENALSYFQLISELEPEDSWAHFNMAVCLAGINSDEEACKSLKRAIELDEYVLYEISYYIELVRLKDSPYYKEIF